ncbi:neurochondrin isoform X1 [Pristis pectinata]|uniref:neurochondrin isoform X1 n=1 Tax=Pristis pectinata TaxID=685728 RepID=UPI00223CB6FB|nr:neurochondrin isoform X1 [Pristis pectinata]XP_051892259.1 neurochondrin isoform X1 [Pristis pectinata]XP_051892260.1 neurochondrin isoform X1 [Pristis pectinata]
MASSSEKIPGTEDEASNKTLERCLKVLQDAKNDSEQFAALLLVTKVVKAGETDAGTRRRIFDAIGFSFPNRLLVTKESPSGCPNQIFRALGMTLFACFSTNPEMVSHPQMFNKIPIFNEIVSSLMEPGSDITTFTSMIDDSYQCLQALSACSEGQRQLVTQGTVSALCRAYQNQCHGCEKALCLLVNLLNAMGNICWNTCKPELLKVCSMLSEQFATEEGNRKFELCNIMQHFLPTTSTLTEDPIFTACLKNCYTGLFNILNSKLSISQRDPALKLAGLLLAVYGSDWILAGNAETRRKFLSLIVNLACVEVRICLEDPGLEATYSKPDVITACYSIIEFGMMVCVLGDKVHLTEAESRQLVKIMVEAFGAIIGYLKQVKEEQLRDPFLFASVRVLSAWMAEETSTLKQEICEVLPFLIHYAEVLFEYPIRSDNMDSEVKELSLTDSSEAKTWSKDALRFLLPGFCHLSAEDAPRRILISHGFHVLLLRYFTQQWEVFNSWQNAPLSPDDAEMNLQTACGVFLNLAVTEPALIRQEECFSSLLNLLLESLQSMLCSQHYLILAANFTTLGLMISRILADTPVLQGNPASREFFRAAIHFLSKAHTTQNEEPDQKTRIVLTERYQEIWDQISELWFLGMQAFSSCIPLLPWLPQSIIESEWLNEIFDLLTQASPMTVEFDLITAFQCVLAELAKNNKSCKDSMLLKNGVEKASLYGMSILEQVLCEN